MIKVSPIKTAQVLFALGLSVLTTQAYALSHTEGSATLLADGQLLLAAGYQNATAEILNPLTGQRSTTGSLSGPRKNHTATLLPDGRVLIAGGQADDYTPYKSVEIFNPTTKTWSLGQPMKEARAFHSATLLNDGKVLITGGTPTYPQGLKDLSSTEIFDPATGEWTPGAPMANPRSAQLAVKLLDGRVLVYAGDGDGSHGETFSFEIYRPDSNDWLAPRYFSDPGRGESGVLLADGRVLVSGGFQLYPAPIPTDYFKFTRVVDPDGSLAWGPDMISGRAGHSSIRLSNDKILLVGEMTSKHPAELFDPATNLFSNTGSTVRLKSGDLFLLPDHKVLLFNLEQNQGELYDPATGTWSESPAPAGPPAPPTGLTATVDKTQVTLSWNLAPDASLYKVYSSTIPGPNKAYAPAGNTVTSSTTVIPRLMGGVAHYFVITGFNLAGESAPSAEVSAVPVSAVYYVDPTGNDANPGTPAQPFKTLTQGMSVLASGDTLMVNPGTYQESFGVGVLSQDQPTVDHPVTIRAANPANRPVIKCSGVQSSVVSLYGPYIIMDGFIVDGDSQCDFGVLLSGGGRNALLNMEVKSNLLEGIYINDKGSNTLTNLDVHGNGFGSQPYHDGIYIFSGQNVIQKSRIYGNQRAGIRVDGLGSPQPNFQNNAFLGNEIYGNGGFGIDISAGSLYQILNNVIHHNTTGISLGSFGQTVSSFTIANNTIVHNTSFGMYAGYGATQVQMTNNILAHQGDSGIYLLSPSPSSGIVLKNNLFFDNTGLPNGNRQAIYDPQGTATSANNILNQDPRFVIDPVTGTGDYHLASGSPAQDAGTSQVAPSVDFDGRARPFGSGFDIGAFESATTITPVLPTPDLSLVPAELPVNATIAFSYPAGVATQFEWSFLRQGSDSSTIVTRQAPRIDLSSLSIKPGIYVISVRAMSGVASSDYASANVRLVLPPPVMDLPSTFPLNAEMKLGIPTGVLFSRFEWLITPQEPGVSAPATSARAMARIAGNASFSTPSPSATAASHGLQAGYYFIQVTGFDGEGNPSLPAQAYTTFVMSDLSAVRVRPSPWRSDLHTGKDIVFDNLPTDSTIKIFTVSGRWVKTLSRANAQASWNLRSDDGDSVASGLYLYLITDSQGGKARGKFAIIR